MKIKKHPISKRSLSFILILAMLFILTAGMVPTIGVAALPSYKNGTMIANQTVYCLSGGSQGGGMTIGSVSSGEAVKVYWQEGSDYYIEYTVSSGSYSGYKRGYVPVSSVSVSGVGSINYVSFNGKVTSTQTVYNRSNPSSMQIGSVYASDTFTILQEDGLWYYIQYPISGGYKRGYIERADIVQPLGVLEAVSFSRIVGYAYDPINPNATIQAHVYIKNNTTGVEYGHALIANIPRAGIGAASGNHGFELDINWADYPPGTYTIRLYAIRGINPQVGIATYNTQNRYSRFYYTSKWSHPLTAEDLSVIQGIRNNYTDFGLLDYYYDVNYPLTALTTMQSSRVTTIFGHGQEGAVSFQVDENNTYWLFSNSVTSGNNASISSTEANSMSQSDIIAFLSCNSATTPAGTGRVSLMDAAYIKGAKVVLGFAGSVAAPHHWYQHFTDALNDGKNIEDAFKHAEGAIEKDGRLTENEKATMENAATIRMRFPEYVL